MTKGGAFGVTEKDAQGDKKWLGVIDMALLKKLYH